MNKSSLNRESLSKSSKFSPVRKVAEHSDLEVVGFFNGWGESNCFLNSALQILYHLPLFRSEVLSSSRCPSEKAHYCLSCGLRDIFLKYSQFISQSRPGPIDISKLRAELASSYSERGEFELNCPGDSIEALMALLKAVHEPYSSSEDSDAKCRPKCPAHQVFELIVKESMVCQCSSKSENFWDYCTFSHHFYVNEIFEDLECGDVFSLLEVKEKDIMKSFELSSVMKCEGRLQEYIKKQWQSTEASTCLSECKNPKSRKILSMLNSPKVFVINLIWKDFRPNLLKILQVYASIPYCLSMDTIYESSESTFHILRSVIFYGMGHYICAIRGSNSKFWFKIDDERAAKSGDGSWKDLIYDCLKSRFYPVGLFYEQSTQRDSNDITADEWMKLERSLLQYLKKNQEEQEGLDWTCECGVKNNSAWNICHLCGKIKPGINGWVCAHCTFVNDNKYEFCKSCKEPKDSDMKEGGWTCECGRKNKMKSLICGCGTRKKCRICKRDTMNRCSECFTVNECRVCKDFIPKRDGKICFSCKKTVSDTGCLDCRIMFNSRIRVCRECTEKLVLCKVCNKFSFPDNEKCMNPYCNKTASVASKTIKAELCKTCGSSIYLCMCGMLSCAKCNKKIALHDKYCLNCKILNSTECEECSISKPGCFICGECKDSMKKCQKCQRFYFGKICENVACIIKTVPSNNSPKAFDATSPSSIKKQIIAKSLGKTSPSICRVCDRRLATAYGFCLDCKLKITAPVCKFCGSNRCTDLCEVCIQSCTACKQCQRKSHISSERCSHCSELLTI